MTLKSQQDEQNKFEDRSNERAYFSMIPRIVWAYCRNPYDYILWGAVRDIAGEKGECHLSTPDLATYCMMSKGSVEESRKYLIERGLLDGEKRKLPGPSNKVWFSGSPKIMQNQYERRMTYEIGSREA